MDAVEIILYVVIMIIWVVVQNARKKKIKEQQEAQRKASQDNYDQFDEEIEEPSPTKRSIVEEIIEELRSERQLEEVEPEHEYAPTIKRDFSEKAISPDKDYEKRLAELKTKKKSKDTARFDSYKIDKKADENDDEHDYDDNEYASLIFEDSDSPKKAIILSEILNRRHF